MTCLVLFLADVVEKLRGQRQLDALRFIFAFGLVEKFPPVPLLKAYLEHQRKWPVSHLTIYQVRVYMIGEAKAYPVSHLTIYLVRVYMTGEAKTYIDLCMMLETTHHLCQDLIYIHQKIYNRLCMGLAPIKDQPIMGVIILAVVCLQQLLTSLHIYVRSALFGILEAMS